jgi:hypothetical protein
VLPDGERTAIDSSHSCSLKLVLGVAKIATAQGTLTGLGDGRSGYNGALFRLSGGQNGGGRRWLRRRHEVFFRIPAVHGEVGFDMT